MSVGRLGVDGGDVGACLLARDEDISAGEEVHLVGSVLEGGHERVGIDDEGRPDGGDVEADCTEGLGESAEVGGCEAVNGQLCGIVGSAGEGDGVAVLVCSGEGVVGLSLACRDM